MERKRITCPETAHLEEIECERTQFGLVIQSCTRFDPAREVRCAGECARRLDRRERRTLGHDRDRVLIVYADAARTRAVAEQLSRVLAGDGFTVELADAGMDAAPPPEDYDAIVVGSPLRFGRHPRAIASYISEHRATLGAMPSFLYFVNHTGFANAAALRRQAGWWPTRAFGFVRIGWTPPDRVSDIALAIADEIPASA